jgi:hypothetical protein
MLNYISIDPSTRSTALVIKSNKGNFIANYTIYDTDYKWMERLKPYIKIFSFNYTEKENYTENEIEKLKQESLVSEEIFNDIISNIDLNEESIITMEGYSFGKNPGPIIDLVGMGQSIRLKIFERLKNLKEFMIISPKTLKVRTCILAYGLPEPLINKRTGEELKKKIAPHSPYGVNGNDFSKLDMYKALMYINKDTPLSDFYKIYKYELDKIKSKDFIKPLDDINDAILLMMNKIENIYI